MSVNLQEALAGSFVVVNLGSGGDQDYDLPLSLLKTITLLEIDGGKNASDTKKQYYKKHTIYDVVAGNKSPGVFTVRHFGACSSLYQPRPEIITEYGLQNFYQTRSVQNIVPVTLPETLDSLKIDSVDFLKTDLEGADYEVIKSCESYIDKILAIKCELRFQPFYEGEPYFHEVAEYLHQHHFELIGLKPEYWKPVTAHRNDHRGGRAVFADALFFKKPEAVRQYPEPIGSLSAAKQIVIACMSDKKSHAEWLLEQYRNLFPDLWMEELRLLVTPSKTDGVSGVMKEVIAIPSKFSRYIRTLIKRNNKNAAFDFSHVASGD